MVTGIAIITGTIVIMVTGDHEDTGTGLRTMATGVTATPITATETAVPDEMTMDVMTTAVTTMEGMIMGGIEMATAALTPESETIIYTATIHSAPKSLIPVITNHAHLAGATAKPGKPTSPVRTKCGKRTSAV